MKRILITGFMPFAGATLNPAWEAVKNVTAPEGVERERLHIGPKSLVICGIRHFIFREFFSTRVC